MLSVQMDDEHGIALLEPAGPLSERDFASAVQVIDPWIEEHGPLKGLIVYTRSFPGWESFGALSSHLAFVRDHHEKIGRVALVTDSALRGAAENIARHFVRAEIKSFPYAALDEARTWVAEAAAHRAA